jgi:DNA-binding NtrC family response regulator
MASPNVVVVSHNLEVQQAFARVLGRCGLAPIVASTAGEAKAIVNCHPVSLIFCSDELLDDATDDLIRQTSWPLDSVPVVVVSRCDDWGRYLDFLRAGAFDYVLYPQSGIEVERIVKSALGIGTLATVQGSA